MFSEMHARQMYVSGRCVVKLISNSELMSICLPGNCLIKRLLPSVGGSAALSLINPMMPKTALLHRSAVLDVNQVNIWRRKVAFKLAQHRQKTKRTLHNINRVQSVDH